MAILKTKDLKNRASQLVSAYPRECRKLVLIYIGVISVLSVGSNALQMFLDSQIGAAGGLSGLGTRTILETIQEILTYINMFFGPFWSAGFLYAMLNLVRGRAPASKDLLEGFRRFFRIVSHVAFELMVTIFMMLGIMNLASIVFAYTPWGTAFAESIEPLLSDPNLFLADGSINLDLIPADAMLSGMGPMMVIFLALFLPAYTYVSYCFRMALYLVVERRISAFRAHSLSIRMMRGHKWQMLKLDLSFWWYYLLGGVISVVGYLDVVLALLGIPLPFGDTFMFFATLVAYCVLSLGLYLWKKCQVDASYVLAYEAIAYPEPVQAPAEAE